MVADEKVVALFPDRMTVDPADAREVAYSHFERVRDGIEALERTPSEVLEGLRFESDRGEFGAWTALRLMADRLAGIRSRLGRKWW